MDKLIIENICRICETKDNLIHLIDEREQIVEMLTSFANISYSSDDELPQFVCQTCRQDIKFCHNFKHKCEIADQKLRNALISIKFDDPLALKIEHDIKPLDVKLEITRQISSTNSDSSNESKSEQMRSVMDSTETVTELQINLKDNFECSVCQKPCKSKRGMLYHRSLTHGNNGMDETRRFESRSTNSDSSNESKSEQMRSAMDSTETVTELQINLKDNFECSVCQKPCKSKRGMLYHRSLTHGNKGMDETQRFESRSTNSDSSNESKSEQMRSVMDSTETVTELQINLKDNFECSVCQKPCKSKRGMLYHRSLTHGNKGMDETQRFECHFCNRVFKSRKGLTIHFRFHTNKKIKEPRTFECLLCKRTYKSRQSLGLHIRSAHSNLEFKCKTCAKTFHNHSNLSRHMAEIHEGRKSYHCAICQKSFAQKSNLDDHVVMHTDETPFQCPMCPFRAKNERRLKAHTNYKHNKIKKYKPQHINPNRKRPQNKIFCTCEYCGKQSKGYNVHLQHVRTHTGERPFKCETCPKAFSQQSALISHTFTHTGELPFKCELCSRKFRQKSQVRSHMRTHTGDKNHICTFCDKAFAIKGNLTVHIRLHTGEMPYRCTATDCDMKFHSINGLKRHRLINHK